MTNPLAPTGPSTSAPLSSGGVTLEAIMVQLECMDAHLDTLSDELCQVNTPVSRITRQQAQLGGFVASPSVSPEASTNEDNDDGVNDDDKDEDEDEDASSSGDDKRTTSQ